MLRKLKYVIKIIKAKFFTKDEKLPWQEKRREICKGCEFNSKNKKKGFREWILYILNFFRPFCTICGCEIKAKTSLDISECPHNPPKWKMHI